MNFIEAVDIFEASATTLIRDTLAADARPVIQATLDAYAQLAPDWTQAPEWAQWYTIDADGEACFTDIESEIVATVWSTYSGNMLLIGSVNLPIGIDWRLCKWQRPA